MQSLGDILTKATNITVINPKEYERYLKTIEDTENCPNWKTG